MAANAKKLKVQWGVGVRRATSTAPAVAALSAVLEVRPTEGRKVGSSCDKAADVDTSLGERLAAGGSETLTKTS
jgi:hypothetical protein